MTEPVQLNVAIDLTLGSSTTPAGLQSTAELRGRRLFVLIMNILTYLALATAMARVLGTQGWTVVDALILACFLVVTPWTVLGFWNAVLGLWLLHFRRNGREAVTAFATNAPSEIHLRTAVIMTLRNENPDRAIARLKIVKKSLDASGFGDRFGYFVLSDTNDPEVAAAEEQALASWQSEASDPDAIVYRRRERNTGFKAGNIREFCETSGLDYDLMLPLDADSLMSGSAILHLVRIMQANPRLGILQSLVVGAPSESGFARIFQFGMRHGMRAYTVGSAWWIGDCGPFWGHNALVRIQPFAEHCKLPVLPGEPPLGGHILSHDQVEATLMRRAGYEVRVLPEENGSWEENPPTVFEFSARDLRWCQGNVQYWRLLAWPGLHFVSRFQLAWAILMFLGVPAMTLLIALAPLKVLDGEDPSRFPTGPAIAVYVAFLLMYLSPKLAGLADILLTRGGVARYGGVGRFLAGATIEIVFSFLLGAVTTFRLTIFMIGLALGRSIIWNGQARDAYGIAWSTACRGLWAPTMFGLAICSLLGVLAPEGLLWSLPLTLGYLAAIPFAVLSAAPRFGRWLKRHGLCAIPEEIEKPAEITALAKAA